MCVNNKILKLFIFKLTGSTKVKVESVTALNIGVE